jgi:hypothetical protein
MTMIKTSVVEYRLLSHTFGNTFAVGYIVIYTFFIEAIR